MYNSLLLTFITTVEAGSMHKAALLLSLSPSAVQKQIRKLEETVSAPLFVNAGKKIILTHAGEYFYKEALEYIKRSQTIIENTQLLSKKSFNKSVLKVGTSILAPSFNMKDALSRFSRFNPDVRISAVSIPDSIETPKDMYDILRRNDIDCFCAPKDIEIDEKKYGFYTLNYSPLCLAAPIGNLLFGADSVSLYELENQEVVINGLGRKEIYDPIRRILSNPDRNVKVISSPTLMTMNTINSCLENNQLLLTFNHWRGLHPCLHFIDIAETFEVPYGILYLKDNSLKDNEQYEEAPSL